MRDVLQKRRLARPPQAQHADALHLWPGQRVEELSRLGGAAEEVGGLGYINALAMSVASATNAVRYAEIVRERADLRRVIAACDEAASKAFSAKDIGPVVESLGATLAQIERRQMRKEPKRLQTKTRMKPVNSKRAREKHACNFPPRTGHKYPTQVVVLLPTSLQYAETIQESLVAQK